MDNERVTTLARLAELANERRAVFVMADGYPPQRRQAAAWVLSMQGRSIHRLMEVGMYVYEKEEKTK